MDEVLVSVIMLVYNHEPYIAQAIEGVLMQQTEFKYELLIGEDCSTDKSRQIIKEYQKRYPDIVKTIYQQSNIGGAANIYTVFEKATGKYWAFCDGDDYWTDVMKLQKQVDFLENNPEFSATYHNVFCVDEIGRVCKRKAINKYPIRGEEIITYERAKQIRLPGQTSSLLCKNIYRILGNDGNINKYQKCICNGDLKFCAILACVGKIYYFKEVMANHRVVLHKGDSYSARMQGKNIQLDVYRAYTELCAYIDAVFSRDFRSLRYEKNICKGSINILKRHVTKDNLLICGKVHAFYWINRVKQCLEKKWI